jgi:hypothetical protein
MVFGLDGDGILAHRQPDQELALRVRCNSDGRTYGLSAGAGFDLSALQNLAVLVQDAARNHNTGGHDQIAEIAGITRHKQERLASQG